MKYDSKEQADKYDMIKTEFKALVFGDEKKRGGGYAHMIGAEDWGWATSPQIMADTATMELLKELSPKRDFSEVELITLKIIPVNSNQ